MANYVCSKIIIIGDDYELKAFRNKVDTEEGWDFSRLFPNPLIGLGFDSPITIVSEKDYALQKFKGTSKQRGVTQLIHDALVEQFGTASWKEWAEKNWGSKWQPFDIELISEHSSYLILNYSTAWSPVSGLWEELSRKFPSLLFHTIFTEEYDHYFGAQVFKAGQMIVEDIGEYLPDGWIRGDDCVCSNKNGYVDWDTIDVDYNENNEFEYLPGESYVEISNVALEEEVGFLISDCGRYRYPLIWDIDYNSEFSNEYQY